MQHGLRNKIEKIIPGSFQPFMHFLFVKVVFWRHTKALITYRHWYQGLCSKRDTGLIAVIHSWTLICLLYLLCTPLSFRFTWSWCVNHSFWGSQYHIAATTLRTRDAYSRLDCYSACSVWTVHCGSDTIPAVREQKHTSLSVVIRAHAPPALHQGEILFKSFPEFEEL